MDKNTQNSLKFPSGFFWGASTSSHQVEGGNHNDWNHWEKANAAKLARQAPEKYQTWQLKKFPKMKKPDNYISGLACDSWNRFEDDLKALKELNVNAYRFSIEWSRIEPEEGKFNARAIKRYQEWVKLLRQNNIEPFVTLWHWTNPIWFSKKGGWAKKTAVDNFLNFVGFVIKNLGPEVRFWITLNEPETYVGLSYVSGKFPPQVKSLWQANKVFKNLMAAHRQAYELIRSRSSRAEVSLAHYLIYQTPYRQSFLNRSAVKILDYFRRDRFLKKTEGCQDFIACQYYHHDKIRLGLGGKFKIAKIVGRKKRVNDLGWEIYPKGIYYFLKKLKKYKQPIYITENGTADAEDRHRKEFIKEHLKYIHQAISEGADVRGYFHWSLLDNFEWADGWWPKFGLYSVDPKTFKRTAKPSAKFYSEICKKNSMKISNSPNF